MFFEEPLSGGGSKDGHLNGGLRLKIWPVFKVISLLAVPEIPRPNAKVLAVQTQRHGTLVICRGTVVWHLD